MWNSTHVRNGQRRNTCTTKLSCSRLGQSHFSDRCPMPARKKVEIRPRAVVSFHYVGGLESMGADEWRAGKSGPGALGSLPKVPRAPRLTNCSPPTTVTVATQPRDDDGDVVIVPCVREGPWKNVSISLLAVNF